MGETLLKYDRRLRMRLSSDAPICPRSWMYWTDWEEDPTESNRGKIKKAWMDGSHHQIFLTSKTVLWPNGLSLDIPQGILYWVDAYYDRIEMVYLNTTERKVGSHYKRKLELRVLGCRPLVLF